MLTVSEIHDKILYTVVRVRSGNAGGSGVLIYSEKDPQHEGRYINIAITCQHVVDAAIKIRDEFDPVLKQQRKTDYFEEVAIEVFDYDGSKLVSSNATNAEIIAYDKHHDLAAVKLNNPRSMPHVASVIPKDEIGDIQIADPVVTCGCSLLHDPFPNNGTLTYLREMIEQKSYLIANPLTFSKMTKEGPTSRIILRVSGKRFRESILPSLRPAAENGGQGNPAVMMSTSPL